LIKTFFFMIVNTLVFLYFSFLKTLAYSVVFYQSNFASFRENYNFHKFHENYNFREFRKNYNFRQTWKSRKFDLLKLAKVLRNTGAFLRVSCFAKILKRFSSKTVIRHDNGSDQQRGIVRSLGKPFVLFFNKTSYCCN
jgi:hypothetical protein